ncbi:uncharacterized protein LOC112083065 [Eutrema salsugineum]|uniref:uncharacterized protein LOC112083065 n=1 Tax=Eutrema salsugineum TaxID=72664 RepID=UPI000CECF943|nr:uncharacterized protein LOC112083065 [Eutrema salsugineum]
MVEKSWVHLNRADPGYERGAREFVRCVGADLAESELIICPCADCRNVDRHSAVVVVDHLVTRGMDLSYKMREDWYHHGEVLSGTGCRSDASDRNIEILGLYQAAEFLDEDFVRQRNVSEVAEGENKEEDEFLAKLADAETPLYPSCTSHSKLSAIVSLFRIKTESGWSDRSFDKLLETLRQMLPEDNVLHTSLYEVKRFLKSFDMGYEKIDACVNDCCLFRKELEKLDNCPKCNASRWKINKRTGDVRKGIPEKVLRYFPIIPRLKRMFRSEDMAKDLRWHFSNKSTDGKSRHPVDSVTWDQMNDKYPSFAAEERNLRLGLSTDGFNPFSMKNVNYSCWPVLLVNYNMSPEKCMKEENIMLSLLIPGPTQLGNNIDVYLEPLIEDLNLLWEKGVVTYDAFSQTTFTQWFYGPFRIFLRMAILQGVRKHVYMSHRKGLPPRHAYRGKKSWFDGKTEYGRKGRILSGRNISQILRNYENEFGNVKVTGKKRKMKEAVGSESNTDDESSESEEEEEAVDEEELSRWKKRSIFFKLPYWEELPVRHNLDVMHVERNVAASLIATLLHCGKSKDGLNARKDLQLLGIRKDLHPQPRGKRTYLPPAPWSFSSKEKKVFCKRLFDFRGPDGYCSNISRCVKIEECKISGMKSHDYQVLMQQLLPVAIRGLLPTGVRIAIGRLCAFFHHLCQRVIDREKISVMETEIVETLCMFERFFPPSFFDIMVHLVVHLGREARLCGPVQFRWMYPFERYMKVLKDFIRNPARPEGCIAEAYLAEECDLNIVHLSVIQNMASVEPYVDMHLQHLQDSNERCRRDATTLWRTHTQKFATWLKEQIPVTSENHDETLNWLAYGPRANARSFSGYIINGLRFHTISVDRQTQNSGVLYEATAMCRSSAKDTSQMVDLVSYYGRVVEIILIDYNTFYIPVFRCLWANIGNGVKVEDGFTLVNLNQSQMAFARDPYILASQAKQVFYSRVDETSTWYVAMRGPTRRYTEEDCEDGHADVGPLPAVVDMDAHDLVDDSTNARADCEGIYV